MKVEVVFAQPDHQVIEEFELPDGSLVSDALHRAAHSRMFHGIDMTDRAVGIFGEVCDEYRVLVEGDRVELYRPLLTDAKTARRLRAEEQTQLMSKRTND